MKTRCLLLLSLASASLGIIPSARGQSPGDLLSSVKEQNQVITEKIQTEVENEIRAARSRMATEPQAVQQGLKLQLEQVLRAPELSSEVQASLRGQIEAALRESAKRAVEHDELEQQRQQTHASVKERQRMLTALERKEVRVGQLMDRLTSLMDEGQYRLAEDTAAAEVKKLIPATALGAALGVNTEITRATIEALAVRDLRNRGLVDTLHQSELAHVPFPDDQPIIHPAASWWQDMTVRRRQYAAVELSKKGGAEEKIRKALADTTSVEFTETPLQDVVDYLKDLHGIEIQLDTKALEEVATGTDAPVSASLKGITLCSALRLILGKLDLTYVVKDEVLQITTNEKAGAALVSKVYPVADLVLPIRQTGFAGGFGNLGGGMQGGGFGQNGGGNGGGAGQFGGFGQNGGGGNNGGGFFSVADKN